MAEMVVAVAVPRMHRAMLLLVMMLRGASPSGRMAGTIAAAAAIVSADVTSKRIQGAAAAVAETETRRTSDRELEMRGHGFTRTISEGDANKLHDDMTRTCDMTRAPDTAARLTEQTALTLARRDHRAPLLCMHPQKRQQQQQPRTTLLLILMPSPPTQLLRQRRCLQSVPPAHAWH